MQTRTRRDFLKTAGLGAAVLALHRGATAGDGAGNRPNILFIMSDDHASHAIGCYGSRINRTPNLDRIAVEGIRLDNCFCTNSLCAPSRATILTGKYSHVNGVTDNAKTFDGGQPTFPNLLRQAGYQTALIGKWHLKSDPTGFDDWCILPGQGVYVDPVMIDRNGPQKQSGYVTDIITDKSLAWLKKRDTGKPFCLLLQHKAPHREWVPDPKHADLYRDGDIPEPGTFNDDYQTRSRAAYEQAMSVEKDLTVQDVKSEWPKDLQGTALKKWKYQRYIKDYLRCVASVDDNVGRVLDFLDQSGLAQNTVVIYTSDNGFFLGDHGWFDKRFMYEESLRMPFLARYPKEIKGGSVNGDIVTNLDFAETFLDYAGIPVPKDMQGRSFRSILRGKSPSDWRTGMYYHYYEFPAVHSVKRHYGLRTRRYKLIHFYNDIDAWELYDLSRDPHELNNVIDHSEYTDVVETLKNELDRLKNGYGDHTQ